MAGSGPRRARKRGDTLPGGYEIQDVKRGGMGIVYLTHNPHFRLPFAVKTFQDNYLANSRTVERFRREAATWIKLGQHPNIVQAFFVDKIDGKPHIFLEWVKGASLRERLRRGRPDLREALDIALQVCRGMAHAHSKLGIVHRDLKPSNVLLSKEGVAKVTDLGLAKAIQHTDIQPGRGVMQPADAQDENLTGIEKAMGTPAYMAPEQWVDAARVDIKADIFSFGVMLYEMLCGTRPFRPKDFLSPDVPQGVSLRLEPRRPSHSNSAISGCLDALVMKCLETNPALRYSSFDLIGAEIQRTFQSLFGQSWTLPEHDEEPRTDPVASLTLKGMSLATLGDHEGAIKLFDRALKMQPDNARALTMKGHSLFALGDNQKAIAYFLEAGLLDPWDAGVHDDLAFCLNETGQHALALKHADQAVAAEPGNSSAWNNRGIALAHLGRAEEAEASFRRALELNPTNAEAWNNLGHMLQETGRTAEAIRCFQKSIRLDPWHTKSYFNYAILLGYAGRFAEAKSVMDELLLVDRENEAAWGLRAALLHDLDRARANKTAEPTRRHLSGLECCSQALEGRQMANEDMPGAHCDFCDRALAFGEGGISNVALFPGYPSGRRRQSLGCVDCMRQRGADDQQVALARKAARVWWQGKRQGKDIYVTPDMARSGLPGQKPGETAERAATDTLPAKPPASEEQEFEVTAGSAELAAAIARRKIPRGHVAVVREVLDGPEGKVRLRVKFGRSPLADLSPSARKAADAEKQRWRNRADDWWASSKRESAHCDDNGCLINGELSMSASKLLLPGDGFMPGGRPILCEECADRRLCEQFAAEATVSPTDRSGRAGVGTGVSVGACPAGLRPAGDSRPVISDAHRKHHARRVRRTGRHGGGARGTRRTEGRAIRIRPPWAGQAEGPHQGRGVPYGA